jgi:hypothetical protein
MRWWALDVHSVFRMLVLRLVIKLTSESELPLSLHRATHKLCWHYAVDASPEVHVVQLPHVPHAGIAACHHLAAEYRPAVEPAPWLCWQYAANALPEVHGVQLPEVHGVQLPQVLRCHLWVTKRKDW